MKYIQESAGGRYCTVFNFENRNVLLLAMLAGHYGKQKLTEFLRSRYLVLRVTGIPERKAKMSLFAWEWNKSQNRKLLISIWIDSTAIDQDMRTHTHTHNTWSRIEDLLDLCLCLSKTRPAIMSLGTMSRSRKNSANRLATSEYASCNTAQRTHSVQYSIV